jgi:acyl transferase domain-containing protein
VIVESAADYLRVRHLVGLTFNSPHILHLNGNGHPNGQVNGTHLNGNVGNENHLVMLQAHDQSSGKRLVQRLAAHLTTSTTPLSYIAYTLNSRRTNQPYKAFITANSTTSLCTKLGQGVNFTKQADKAPVIAFVFTGQGAQWHAMGRNLIESSLVFGESMRRTAAVLK